MIPTKQERLLQLKNALEDRKAREQAQYNKEAKYYNDSLFTY